MNMRDQLPTLFMELHKLCEPLCKDLHFPTMTRNEASGLSMYEDDDHLYLEAAVPGVKPDQIQISVEKGLVYITAEAQELEAKDKKMHFKTERAYSYRIPLPMRIDEQSAPEASCKDGILKITMAKSRACKPIRIAVKSS